MKLAYILKHGFPDAFEIVLADVGSAGGLHKRWQQVRPIVSALMFEPREGGETKRIGRDRIYPFALGSQAGKATLNITALPNMSSTLLPNRELMESFRKKDKHIAIESTLEMPVDTLDAIVAADGIAPDVIKVDTQGSELSILEGARSCLAHSVLWAEIEVSFLQRYQEQALAGDVIAFMRENDFVLLDLYRLKRYRRKNSAGIGNLSLGGGQRAGRLAYGDAIFMLDEKALMARMEANPMQAEALLLKAMTCLLIYGKPDMAASLFSAAGDVIAAERKIVWQKMFTRLGRQPFGSGIAHHIADYLARHV